MSERRWTASQYAEALGENSDKVLEVLSRYVDEMSPARNREHKLKTLAPHFWDVVEGRKTFEVRKEDRGFRVGDTLRLLLWLPVKDQFGIEGIGEAKVCGYEYQKDADGTERRAVDCVVEVTHILSGGQFGIEPGYCVMSTQLREVHLRTDEGENDGRRKNE